MQIFYHDWGTYDELAVNEVCPINDFAERPMLCRRIRIAEDTDDSCKGLNVDDELSVKALNVLADGTIIVQVQPTKKIETPVKTVEVTEKVMIIYILTQSVFTITIVYLLISFKY